MRYTYCGMLPRDFIGRVIHYYTSEEAYHSDIDLAIMTFFNLTSPAEFDVTLVTPLVEGLVNEWLIFDFQLSDGQTPLQHWVTHNPQAVSDRELNDYKSIVQTHVYSFFEIRSIQLGHSFILRDVFTDQSYEVTEKKATYQAQIGYIFPTRLAQYRTQWYMVAANTIQVPIRLDDRMREYLSAHPPTPHLTPKDIWQVILNKASLSNNVEPPQVERSVVQKNMIQLLKQFKLDQMITVELIEQWLYEDTGKDGTVWVAAIVCSLIDRECFTPEQCAPLLNGLQVLSNVSPRASFSGQSPEQRYLDNQAAGKPYQPELISTMFEIGGGQWLEHHNEAFRLMQLGKYQKAIAEYKYAFRWLMKHRVTEREIYRLFANTAMAHFAGGQEHSGVTLLDYALELNSNYDFARRIMERYRAGTLLPAGYHRTRRSAVRDPLTRHPAKQYMNWLRYLGINFTTPQLTQTPIQPIVGQ